MEIMFRGYEVNYSLIVWFYFFVCTCHVLPGEDTTRRFFQQLYKNWQKRTYQAFRHKLQKSTVLTAAKPAITVRC
jgi:hypothetical protein